MKLFEHKSLRVAPAVSSYSNSIAESPTIVVEGRIDHRYFELMIKRAGVFIEELEQAAIWIEPTAIVLVERKPNGEDPLNWAVTTSPNLPSVRQEFERMVVRMAHGYSPTANLAVLGITKPPNPESQNARKPGPTHGFLAKSNTCSREITATDQSLPNSSRATSYSPCRSRVRLVCLRMLCGEAGRKAGCRKSARPV